MLPRKLGSTYAPGAPTSPASWPLGPLSSILDHVPNGALNTISLRGHVKNTGALLSFLLILLTFVQVGE